MQGTELNELVEGQNATSLVSDISLLSRIGWTLNIFRGKTSSPDKSNFFDMKRSVIVYIYRFLPSFAPHFSIILENNASAQKLS